MKITDGLLAFGCALLFTVPLPAQTNGPASTQEGQRFLFLVDTSASMRKVDESARQAIFDLIYFGLDGQMKKGDTFGIWSYNEKLNAGQVPMQTWDPDNVLSLASLGAKYIQAQKFEGKSLPQVALARVAGIIRNVKDLNVFMITDGQAPITGTGFEHQINPVYEHRAAEREKAKKPFITTFIARGGQVTNASVTLAGEPVLVPPPSPAPREIVLRPKPPATNSARVAVTRVTPIRKTNSTPLIIRPAALQASAPAPVNASTNRPSLAAEEATTSSDPADLIGANEAPRFSTSSPLAVTNTARSSISNAATVALQKPEIQTPVAKQPATNAAPAATPTALTNVARVERTTNLIASVFPDTPVAAREPFDSQPAGPAYSLSPSVLIAAGVFLLVGSLGLVFFGFRRGRAANVRPSFISQSMERR